MAAAADCVGRRRFAAACGVLSRRVRAEAGKLLAPAPTMLLLMPGADVGGDIAAEEESPAAPQLTIVYGGRVLVFDGVAADRAAELVRVAAGRQGGAPVDGSGGGDMPVARKASLQRFMEKRRDRLAARAPYAAASPSPAMAAKSGTEERHAACWLELGIPGVSAAR